MKKTTLSLSTLSILVAAGCSFDSPSADPVPRTVQQADLTPAAGPALESVDGFPIRLVDRFLSFDALVSMLTEATESLPGKLRSEDTVRATHDFLNKVSATSPPFRLAYDEQAKKGAVRLVQVYTDAPVYIIGGFALLPDSAGVPVDPARFALDGSTDTLTAFCTQSGARCIPLSREHVENRKTSVVVLAARTIIARG